MKKFFAHFAAAALLCASAAAAELNIAAAANIAYPLKEIESEFNKKYPDIKLKVNIGASGGFNAQIKQGAPYDVFLSADMGFAQDLEKLAKNSAKAYTQGVLMLFSPVHKNISLNHLRSAKCLAIANEKTAPYGRAAMQVLSSAQIDASKIIVRAPSIAAALASTLSACEYGMVAASARQTLLERGFEPSQMLLLDGYEPILQGMIVLKNSAEAAKFEEFILGAEAKKIFSKYGYK